MPLNIDHDDRFADDDTCNKYFDRLDRISIAEFQNLFPPCSVRHISWRRRFWNWLGDLF